MNEGLQVIMVSAFYRDDKPGGIAAGMRFDAPDQGVDFCRMLEDGLREYDSLTLDEVLSELTRLAPSRHELTSDETAHVVMCIYWMRERGYIQPDEYNGPIFACITGDTVACCERNPVTFDVATKVVSDEAVDVTAVVRASKAPMLDRGLTASLRAIIEHARRRTT